MPDEPHVRWAQTTADVNAAHALFLRRIGPRLVEDAESFRISATLETADWVPRLGLVEVDGQLAAAQLGGLLPAVGMLSLPYTAVAEPFEGRGVYRRLKESMLEALRSDARARGLPEPVGNVAEERVGSAQYRRKVEGGIAVVLPLDYVSPSALGLTEEPLALTYEPLTDAPPPTSPHQLRTIVAAVYRGLYRVAEPEHDSAFRRSVASLGGLTALAVRVRAAHGDAWQVEGRLREPYGGGVHAVRGARLMASGIPTPKWNNADISSADVDLDAISAWYAARDLPWGVRVPVEIDLAIGEPLFTKRCFGLGKVDAPPAMAAGDLVVRRAGLEDLEAYIATDATVFDDDPALTRRWVVPVFGRPEFEHWLAYDDGMPVGVACTVHSDAWAGPAAMMTGVGVLPRRRDDRADRSVERALIAAALESVFAAGAALAHAYADQEDEARLLRASGFTEVSGLTVRVVRPA
ncbi:MAG: hypothetical protein ACRDJE_11490 [Dehalococcoidia bacterium]